MPELIIVLLGVFRLADNHHFLLFKLMNTIQTSLFNAMRTDFLPEARAVGGQLIRKTIFLQRTIHEAADHGMLGSTDQI